MPVKIFFCYAHEDEALLNKLKAQLSPLQRQGLIDVWHDREISAGTEWEQEINDHLNAAQIVLLLVSPDFMNSDYCYSIEMKRAMERHEVGEAQVIPVILRPIEWESAPFGKLQALPTHAKPVTTWDNQQDEAFYDIAKGVKRVAQEFEKWKRQQQSRWIRQQQPRMLSLFGYETNGGPHSALWENPHNAELDIEKFQNWRGTKREFKKEELINHIWIKSRGSEPTYFVQFLSNGDVKESIIFDPDSQWQGSWQFSADGVLKINVGEYELDMIADKSSSLHTGIEYKKGKNVPFAHYVLFLPDETTLKHWSFDAVPALVEQLFDQVLNRHPNQRELIVYGSLLYRGEMSIRSMRKILGLSQEYRERFLDAKTIEDAVAYCYQQFLGREIDPIARIYFLEKVEIRGFSWLINALIEGNEYGNEQVTFLVSSPYFST